MKRKKVMMDDMLLALVIVGSICLLARNEPAFAQASVPAAEAPAVTPATKVQTPTAATKPSAVAHSPAPAKNASPVGAPMRYAPNPLSKRAQLYYDLIWGVDSLIVKYAESGEMIRFSYRVLDSEKAKPLNDKKNEPSLIDPKAGVKLVVPSLEKVGKLRQSSTPEAGKMYWMAFSNKGRLVKPGDRVNVVIGKFQANGLVVE
jgi:hypothetical protein